jgi:hypothetical protein
VHRHSPSAKRATHVAFRFESCQQPQQRRLRQTGHCMQRLQGHWAAGLERSQHCEST